LRAAPALAGAGDTCCADLEARISELEETVARKGNRKVELEIGGFVNEVLQIWDDGGESNTYIVTNDVERSRFAFDARAKIDDKWKAGLFMEIGVRANRSNRVDQNTPTFLTPNPLDTRYLYWWIENKELGKVSIGRTAMASYHIVEMMTAGTAYFAKQSFGAWLGENGGGFFLRKQNGVLLDGTNPLRWGDINAHGPQASPGDGDRLESAKYETPTWKGFTASAAYAAEAWDVALRYKGEIGDFKLAAGIGYGLYDIRAVRRCAAPNGPQTVDCRALGMSGSIMHKPTGLYVYSAYGEQHDFLRQELFGAAVDDVDSAFYAQVGIEHKWFTPGKTIFYAEYEQDNIGAGVNPNNGGILNTSSLGPTPADPDFARMSSTDIEFFGIGANQAFADQTVNLYVAARRFKADVYTSATGLQAGAIKNPIDDFTMVMTGAKVEF
jgi:hypothetical protein